MLFFWIVLGVAVGVPLGVMIGGLLLYVYVRLFYFDPLVRIFQEKPLFVIPRGQPVADAEDAYFQTANGLRLHGCYFRTSAVRRGVVLFGLEFGSNCWASVPYCESLLADGFDVFTFEPRNVGDSDQQAGYEPLQWVTEFEVEDFQAAIRYLITRPDAHPCGIGVFGISKGASAGIIAAAREPSVRCIVTDGAFATHTTMVPYMQKWIQIYSRRRILQAILPLFYYSLIAYRAMQLVGKRRRCRFVHVEPAIGKLGGRPILMIHGGGDTYIKPEMARDLFDRARDPKELWMVEGAKHNQAVQVAGPEYHQKVLAFFREHLDALSAPRERSVPARLPARV